MRDLKRNQSTFWYCNFVTKEAITDDQGNLTGDYRAVYDDPVEVNANVSAASGAAMQELFGAVENYDKIIVTVQDLPISETTVLFVDKEPEHNLDGDWLYDYVVRRVARTLNHTLVAISKVNLS